MVYMQTTK